MIARTWHGIVPEEKGDAYLQYVIETGVADYRSTQGFRGVRIMRRKEAGVEHFLVTSLWDSLNSIRAFAGDDIDRARYYPQDTEYLIELEPTVEHWQVWEL